MSRIWMPIIALAVGACDDAGRAHDASVQPSADSGAIGDAGVVVDATSGADASAGTDAGNVACEPACGVDERCQERRCVRSCPCELGERCDPISNLCRPRSCSSDRVCPSSLVCLQSRCVRLRNSCSSDSDCPELMKCSDTRMCTQQDCISHTDCASSERCARGRCIRRVSATPRILFERTRDARLELHFSSLPGEKEDRHEEPDGQYGYGAALFDYDGDLDLDVYIGSQTQDQGTGASACLYRNESVPGLIRFLPVSRHCEWRDVAVHGAFALDLELDGFHELLLVGERTIVMQRFHPQEETENLRDLIPLGDPRRTCLVASAISVDLNYDGRLDLYMGCQLNAVDYEINAIVNIVFLQTTEGGFEYVDDASVYPLLSQPEGSTLALGAADLNDDGLLELLISQDSIPLPGGQPTHPGGIYRRCQPHQACHFESYPLGQGEAGLRNLMGSGVLHLEGHGEFIYYTDIDENQLVQMTSEPAYNRALEFGAALDRASFEDMVESYSWGVVIDDFDRDGHDDVFVARGSLVPHPAYDFAAHWDALLLQRPGQRFDVHSDDVGITPFSTNDTGHEEFVYASRAVLKADLDYDGHLDLFGLGMEGPPRVHREVPLAPAIDDRCTLVPVSRYAPGFGTGYQVIPPNGPARKWESQGQIRSSTSPFVLSAWQRSSLRFPSGAAVPFDCQGRPGPLVVVEPEWLTLSSDAGNLLIQTTATRPEGQIRVLAQPSMSIFDAEVLGAGRARVALPQGQTAVMLRFGDRWLPRWFDLQDL